MSPHLRPACFFLLFGLLSAPSPMTAESPDGVQQAPPSSDAMRELRHQDPQWDSVKTHLPDPATATAEQLELVGDVLRARRFPEDALDYYIYALKKGGSPVMLMNKIGVTQFEPSTYCSGACLLPACDSVEAERCGGVEQSGGG